MRFAIYFFGVVTEHPSLTSLFSDLLSKVDPAAFVDKFGVDLSQAQTLIEAKTLTISKLMTIMPQGNVEDTTGQKVNKRRSILNQNI